MTQVKDQRHEAIKYETGATSHAVNDLILFTDNTPVLVAIRDGIYQVMTVIPYVSLEPLLQNAIRVYSEEFGINESSRHIRLMNLEKRQEYCTLYEKGFENWKKENGIN